VRPSRISGIGHGPLKGPLLGTNPAIDRETLTGRFCAYQCLSLWAIATSINRRGFEPRNFFKNNVSG
jgi:hypothetical protein